MGFFSWLTENTMESIPSSYSNRDTFTVTMVAPDGTLYQEDAYEGYGDFGGKDYYELLAEINGLESNRELGIKLAFSGKDDVLFPQLLKGDKKSISPTTLKYLNFKKECECCEAQGFFYGDEDEDDEEDDW